ncbi:MAG: PhoH family protein [Bacteriodetes bacterium]|nr:PhoH family protein [Bacteroidota bacterium]
MDYLEKKIKLGEIDPLLLLGTGDAHLQLLESKFSSSITYRNNTLTLKGEPKDIKDLENVLEEMLYVLKKKGVLSVADVQGIITVVQNTTGKTSNGFDTEPMNKSDNIILWGRKEPIKVRNAKQQEYFSKVKQNDVVFAIGPAGTGKTYLAVAMALAALRNNEVSRIVLSRPAVEAGESLGFLPGDLFEKIDPYLRPLLDAVSDMLAPDKLKSLNEKNIIEIIPLAYMRGRTLNNAFVILDEAQNTTETQMKMFLTRLGNGSRSIITGDVTQIDLPSKQQSGLMSVQKILKNIEGIGFVYFDKQDVVRHKLVADIISAYERTEQHNERVENNPPTNE